MRENRLIVPLVIFLIIFFDQTLKYKIAAIACNRGIAFGINVNATLISVFVLLVIFGIFLREKNQIARIGFLMILAGGFSNLLDRLVVGCVRDFIKIGAFSTFNFADAAITVGVCVLLWGLFSESSGSSRKL